MTIRITYKKKDDIINIMHYYNFDHIRIECDDNGILSIKLFTITGRLLNAIAITDEIECATMEENHYLWSLK